MSDKDSGIAATIASTQAGGPAVPDGEPDLPAGTTIGDYTIEGKLGEGGFGVVYRGMHPVIGKQVAIKILNRTFSVDPSMVSRFVAEARAVNQIRHRNIIDIFLFGALPDGRQYYVMELLSGMPLDAYLASRGGRIAPEEALPLLRAVARALDAAHAKGIAHRDLKPENVFVADDDGVPFPKLLDFGIAKLLSNDAPHKHKTRTGAPMGTPTYMSPEQCRGKDIDHRTDIYSFGIMTYQLFTGVLPFRGEDFVELLMQQTQEDPVPPSQVYAELPPSLDVPIMHMMKKDPAQRPPSVTAAVDAMYVALGMPVPQTVASSSHMSTPTSGVRSQVHTPVPAKTPSPSAYPGEHTMPVRKSGGNKVVLYGILAAVVLAAGAAVLVVAMREPEKKSEPAAGPKPPEKQPEKLPEKTPEKQPEKQPEKTPEAPPPVMVEITISDAPDGTQVYGPGGVLLATLPGKLEVRRSDEPLQITLKHDGFDTRVEKIAVASATKIALPLQKTKVPKPPVGPGSQKPPVGPGSQKPPKPPKPPGGPGSSDIPEF